MTIRINDDGIIDHSPFSMTCSSEPDNAAQVAGKQAKGDVDGNPEGFSEPGEADNFLYVKQMIFTSEADDSPDVELEIDDVSDCGDIEIDSLNISKSTMDQLLDMNIVLDDVFAFGKRIKRSKSGWWSTRSCDIGTRGVVALLNLAKLPGYVFTLQTEQSLFYWTTPYGKPNRDNVQFYAQVGKFGLVEFNINEPKESPVTDEDISEELREAPGWILEALNGFIHQRTELVEIRKDSISSHVKASVRPSGIMER